MTDLTDTIKEALLSKKEMARVELSKEIKKLEKVVEAAKAVCLYSYKDCELPDYVFLVNEGYIIDLKKALEELDD